MHVQQDPIGINSVPFPRGLIPLYSTTLIERGSPGKLPIQRRDYLAPRPGQFHINTNTNKHKHYNETLGSPSHGLCDYNRDTSADINTNPNPNRGRIQHRLQLDQDKLRIPLLGSLRRIDHLSPLGHLPGNHVGAIHGIHKSRHPHLDNHLPVANPEHLPDQCHSDAHLEQHGGDLVYRVLWDVNPPRDCYICGCELCVYEGASDEATGIGRLHDDSSMMLNEMILSGGSNAMGRVGMQKLDKFRQRVLLAISQSM